MMDKKKFIDVADQREAWNYLVEHMFDRRNAELESMRLAVRATSVPVPNDILQRLVLLNPTDAHDVLREHPGFKLWDRYRSYENSYQLFDHSFVGIRRAIEKFESDAEDGSIFTRVRTKDLDDIQQSVQKELFTAANAAASLVDHSRRLQKFVGASGYTNQLVASFGEDGLHEFIIDLRVMLHHLHVVKPGYQWQKRFEEDAKTKFSFTFSRDALVQAANDTDPERLKKLIEYLSSAPEKIDVKLTWDEYRRRAEKFHAWFSETVKVHSFENVRDYERCVKENKNFASRTFWNATLGNWLNNWKVPPNPYNHLAKYLTPEQIVEVYALPMGSTEQVDKVIEFVDEDEACDQHIRQQAYELFRRAIATETAPG